MEPNVSVHHGGKMSQQNQLGVTRRAVGIQRRSRENRGLAGVCSPPARPTLSRFPLPNLRDPRDARA
jgi:hypothetical protein